MNSALKSPVLGANGRSDLPDERADEFAKSSRDIPAWCDDFLLVSDLRGSCTMLPKSVTESEFTELDGYGSMSCVSRSSSNHFAIAARPQDDARAAFYKILHGQIGSGELAAQIRAFLRRGCPSVIDLRRYESF